MTLAELKGPSSSHASQALFSGTPQTDTCTAHLLLSEEIDVFPA